MSLEKYLEKEIQKKWKWKRGALAGRSVAPGPPAEAGTAHQRVTPSPRQRPRPRADGRAVAPWRAGRARPPRGARAPGWTHPGRPLGAPGRASLLPRCHLHPSTPPLSFSRPCSVRTTPPRAIGAPRASSALFPASHRTPAPSSTSPSSAFASAHSDEISSRR